MSPKQKRRWNHFSAATAALRCATGILYFIFQHLQQFFAQIRQCCHLTFSYVQKSPRQSIALKSEHQIINCKSLFAVKIRLKLSVLITV